MDFLPQNRRISGEPLRLVPPILAGQACRRHGGGDTGSDCIGTGSARAPNR